jgi:tetratricopeptide (TPR) repeat protein
VLTGGARDTPARHQTLRATIAWSYNLLDETEQAFFCALAAFSGSCTIEAVEGVFRTVFPDGADQVLDALTSLVEKNLLRTEVCGEDADDRVGIDSAPRFCLLETVREYSLERLRERPEAQAIYRAHAEFFAALAEAEVENILSPDARQRLSCMARMRAEHDNLRAALLWSLDHDANLALRLVHGSRAMDLDVLLGDAERAIERALQNAGEVSPRLLSAVLGDASMIAASRGNFARQAELARQRLELMRDAGEPVEVTWALFAVGAAARGAGDYETAHSHLTEALVHFRELEAWQNVGWTLNQLGDNARAQNDLATARAFFEESADAFQLCGDRDGVAGARGQLADVSNHEGDLATARRLMNEVTAIERELGDNRAHPHRRFQLAQLEVSEGQFSAAHRHFAEGLRGFTSTGDLVGILLSLLGFAWLAEAQGQWHRVVTLLACEEAQRQSLKWPPALQWETVRTRALTSAREALGDEVFEKTWQAGQAMTIEQISEYSLKED